jgi:glyoxylase-like metal-dependent hydrolase (beta-lactamase superfamily II)
LADDKTAHGWCEDRRKSDSLPADFLHQQLGEALDGVHTLAHLRALEVVAAVKPRAEHKVALQKRACASEDIDDFLLSGVHCTTLPATEGKNKNILLAAYASSQSVRSVANPTTTSVPLEDELGDVIDKAMHSAGLTDESLAQLSGVSAGRILDAIDYRSDLSVTELHALARSLGLNELGLAALASGRYPLPAIGPLPFCVWPLRMPHGIGVANAYLVGECGSDRAVLFDTGAGLRELEAVWPIGIRQLDAVFLTHVEAEHAGGLCEVVARFDVTAAFVPQGAEAPCGQPVGEGAAHVFGPLEIVTFATPGHAKAHNSYLVRSSAARFGEAMLISGDLVFAGSAGGGYFSHEQQRENLRRLLNVVPRSTIIAPGHGPLTTVENELRFNPFVV